MYNTDKKDHGYMPFYEKNLPKNPKKLLEIGVKSGESIRLWQKYFPQTEIHGLDLFQLDPIPDIKGVKFWTGNQTDQYILEQLRRENFDVIIDDASHGCRHHWITFWSLINSCQQYYIEDLHTCTNDFFMDGLTYEQTILSCCKVGLLPFNIELSSSEKIVLICPKNSQQ